MPLQKALEKTKRTNPHKKRSFYTKETDNYIKERVVESQKIPNTRNIYSVIQKEIKKIPKFPQLSGKQIRHRWINELDPKLCHYPLSEEEKAFVIEWVEDTDGIISWKKLSLEMDSRFGNLRSENILKNFWYARKRRNRTLPPLSSSNATELSMVLASPPSSPYSSSNASMLDLSGSSRS